VAPVRFVRVVLALGIVGLLAAGVYLLGEERRASGGDGAGYRLALESPSTMQSGVCPDYRDNAGAKYLWDLHAFTGPLEAQLSHCGRIDTGPLGEWVVEERSDSRGGYSISAHLGSRDHTVDYDWGAFAPSLSLNCWRGDSEQERPDRDGSPAAEMFLDVWLWHFGPPQRSYGEPTPVQYRFEGRRPDEAALWSGHPAQAEVTVLPTPVPGTVEQDADSRKFAARLRQATAEHKDQDSGPMLELETWSGAAVEPRGRSQGTSEFDLLGVERAAFPVLDACGV
jgi:hypothetical protein